MTPIRIAIAGLGSIGKALAATLDADGIPGLRLTAVSARDLDRARLAVADFRHPVAVVPLAELEPLADWVVECAPAALLPSIVTPFLAAGKPAIVLSVGALLAHPELIETARRHGSHLHVPTGALIGLDAVLAAAEGRIDSVELVTRKPPAGLAGAPHLVRQGISLEGLQAPLCVFAGTARQAVEGFPANANVAAALSLAGIGPERTRVEIWADPLVSRNTHQITVDADSARFTMTIENIASANPRTSRSAVQSLVALLRKMTATLKVGT
ncbi:MAG: aspartate dehydrogenase [Burkholderiales bacterium]|nr:aspartate dehydrogenase [Burkholderiales bacterium]